MSLSATQIRFAYAPPQWTVRDLDIEARQGELLGIIGPNGSGKSTLLRLLGGVLKPASGSVEVDGRPLGSLAPRELARRVAFLPQMVRPAFAFTCEEVVAQGRYPQLGMMGFLSAEDLEVVRRSLERTGVAEFADRPVGDVSGGERQRVLIASVLAQEADHLLLDEPTAALDIHHQARIFQLLDESARQGLAVVVVVHDLNLAAQYCQRLALMSAGRIVAEGTAREVLTSKNLAPVYGGNIAVGENLLSKSPLVTVVTE